MTFVNPNRKFASKLYACYFIHMNKLSTLSLFFLTLVGCGISSEQAQDEFDEYVAANNTCTETSDCAYVNATPTTRCGIYVVSQDKVDDALEEAERIFDSQRSSDQTVQTIACLEPEEAPLCVENHCAFP